ncbi:MAG TPA: hypothetical protein V6D14_30190 [Coleofasciculaceae cyanobacterium]
MRERSGLLIEAPSQILDLGDYPKQNRDDVQGYIQQCLTPLTSSSSLKLRSLRLGKGGTRIENSLGKEGTKMEESESSNSPPFLTGALVRRAGGDLRSWLTTHNINEQEFCTRLTAQTENNFMYLSQILAAITEGFYSQALKLDRLPPNLEAYYQSHWQRMAAKELSLVELGVLRCLVSLQPSLDPLLKKEGISAQLIAEMIDQDEYDVEAVLENWIEFLQQEQIDGETRYSLYHSSFRDWLGQQLSHH